MNTNDSLVESAASWVNQNWPKLPGFFVGLAFGFVLIRIGSWIGHFVVRRLKLPRGLKGILNSLIDGILWFLYVVAILQALGFRNIIIFFTSSVAAIGLIMAAGGSTLISDIFAGIFLAQDKDFRIGDEVIAGDPPTQGIVEAMDMRRTRVRDKAAYYAKLDY
jgi:small-conductance mechanosensitive channel